MKLRLGLLSDPHLTFHLARVGVGVAWASWALKDCEVGARVTVMGPLDVKVEGTAKIGHHAYFLPGVLTTEISVAPGAELEVGPYSGFNCGVRLIATRRLVIGERVMVASMVTLTDVTLEDHVWVAHGAMLDPGVTIGEGSVVAAGSHVTRDVPPRSLAIGTPARNLKLDTLSRGR